MPRQNTGPRLFYRTRSDGTPGRWYIRWYERGVQKLRSTEARDPRDRRPAEVEFRAFLEGQERSARLAAGHPREPADVPIDDVLSVYLEEKAPEHNDASRTAIACEHLALFWGQRLVSDVSDRTIKQYLTWRLGQKSKAFKIKRAKPITISTVRRELVAFRAALNYAVRTRRLTHFEAFVLPDESEARDVWLTRSQVAQLLWAARKVRGARLYLPLFVLSGVYSATRKMAITDLQFAPWPGGGHVDLAAGVMHRGSAGRVESAKRKPPVPIARPLMTFLRLARRRNKKWVIEDGGERVRDLKRSFASAVAAAGLPKEVTPHALKHTAGSWVVQRTGNLYLMAKFLGVTQETAERSYAHHAPDFLEQALEAVAPTARAGRATGLATRGKVVYISEKAAQKRARR